MNPQHGLQCEGRASVLAFGVVRGDELDQSCPRYDVFHLGQKLALAGLLGVQVQFKAGLFHGLRECHAQGHLPDGSQGYAEFP